jgi:8-oxo-dGTP pyrophosphatase MutT (NUDIX family)
MNSHSAANVTTSGLDCASFANLARSRLLQTAPIFDKQGVNGEDELNPGAISSSRLDAAAVLIPILAGSPLRVLLTERTEHLSSHAGQIAFPGGRIDPCDASPMDAALREAREEIALDAVFAEPLGYLCPYRTGTGFIITPAVALIRPGFTVTANPAEVADVFEVPLAFLMSEANHRIESRMWQGTERRFYAMPYGERYIWGATAGIIRSLYLRLFTA